jgi:hypothetical protein
MEERGLVIQAGLCCNSILQKALAAGAPLADLQANLLTAYD